MLKNVPNLMDIKTIIRVIEYLGAKCEFDTAKNTLKIGVRSLCNAEVPYDLVKTMRASVYVMGPLLARCGEADVSLPGGCAIGERPVDIAFVCMKSYDTAWATTMTRCSGNATLWSAYFSRSAKSEPSLRAGRMRKGSETFTSPPWGGLLR